jgi:IS30 family transposase
MDDELASPKKQLDAERRRMIEQGLDESKTFSHIADRIGVWASTVRREVLRNRRCEGMSYAKGADKNNCAHLKSCHRKNICGAHLMWAHCGKRLCRRCEMTRCQNYCDDYETRICQTVLRAPFVCNACERYGRCTLERWRYLAGTAQHQAKRRSHGARCGIDMTSEEMAQLTDTVRQGLRQGQSVHHIFATEDLPCSERSFYRYVHNEDIPILPIELAKKVKYKKRRHAKTVSHEAGFYSGHEYGDYLALDDEDRSVTTEVDTVLGKRTDRKCILSLHRADLHFQIYLLLGRKTKEESVKAMGWLEECAEGRFSEFFGLCLLDRGAEFDDIAGTGRSAVHEGTRCAAYFTDPSRPDQKGSCEKNHVELRKVSPKGTSLDAMDAATSADICSHVNSTARKGCGDASPMQLAQLVFPRSLLDSLGLRLIPPKDVISAPGILYDPNRKADQ